MLQHLDCYSWGGGRNRDRGIEMQCYPHLVGVKARHVLDTSSS